MKIGLCFAEMANTPLGGYYHYIHIGKYLGTAFSVMEWFQLFTFQIWVGSNAWVVVPNESSVGLSIGYHVDEHPGTVKGPVTAESWFAFREIQRNRQPGGLL